MIITDKRHLILDIWLETSNQGINTKKNDFYNII